MTSHPNLKYSEKWVFRCSFRISTYPRKKRKAIINFIVFDLSGVCCIIVSVGLLYRKCDVLGDLGVKKKRTYKNKLNEREQNRTKEYAPFFLFPSFSVLRCIHSLNH